MLLIANGRVITRDENNPYIENGGVCIDGTQIVAVGSTQELSTLYPDAQFINAKGGTIMPGLINTHNHIYSAFARGLIIRGHRPENFMDVLAGQWWKLDNTLSMQDVRYSALATYLDCIQNGVTTVFDHHASYACTPGSLFTISDAATELGVRTCLCYEVSDRNGEERMKEAVLENEKYAIAALYDQDDMHYGMMGLHASLTLSDGTLEYCKAHTPSNVGFHIHVAEGIADVHDCLKKYSKRIVERLFDLEILGSSTLAAHCIHINNAEMDLLARTDTMVVHNPQSNMGNAVGCGAVLELLQRGILVGLGTDGYTNDMLESLKVANLLHKHHLCHPNVAWTQIPQMLYYNNAEIAGRFFSKPLGILREGGYADVIVTDYIPLTPMDEANCNGHILFGMSGRGVVTTVINGKVLMKDRALVADKAEILAKCREQAETLWSRINV